MSGHRDRRGQLHAGRDHDPVAPAQRHRDQTRRGVFAGTTHIHRVNTVGGRAPTTPGSAVGALTSVAYTTEYFFYTPAVA